MAGGLDRLPRALRELADLRLEHPEVSLRELGELADPPLSKSAVYHRIRRIEALAAELTTEDAQSVRAAVAHLDADGGHGERT
jgi:DNA-binding transcriptional regulator WhiA